MEKNQILSSKTALLVIDVQQGLFRKKTPIYQADQLLENIQILVDNAHAANAPIIYVQHADRLALIKGSPDWQLHPSLQPMNRDFSVYKEHGNAFEQTNLDEILKRRGVGRVVVCGLVTHGCVRATCLGAIALGYQTILAQDAHSNYSKNAAQLIVEWNAKLAAHKVELQGSANIAFD